MSMNERARAELKLAGFFDKDSDYEGMVGKAVMELWDKFSEQGHSGMSAGLVANLFAKLVKGDNLTPLTGEPKEWTEITDGMYQNKRNSAVFAKGPNGEGAYYIDGRVFNGWTNYASKARIKFPCRPKTKHYPEWMSGFFTWKNKLQGI